MTVTLLVLMVTGCAADPAPAEQLRSKVEGFDAPSRFGFEYRAGGTRVGACFRPNRTFTGLVDRTVGVLALGPSDATQPIAYVSAGSVFLRTTLLAKGATDAGWVAARGPLGPALRSALVRAIGEGLTGYVATGLLPPDGRDTTLSLLEVASDVRRLSPVDGAVRFRLDIPGERLAASASQKTERDKRVGDVRVEVSLAKRRVTQVMVEPVREGGARGADQVEEASGSWTIVYRESRQSLTLPDVGPFQDLGGIDPARLGPPPITHCEVPL